MTTDCFRRLSFSFSELLSRTRGTRALKYRALQKPWILFGAPRKTLEFQGGSSHEAARWLNQIHSEVDSYGAVCLFSYEFLALNMGLMTQSCRAGQNALARVFFPSVQVYEEKGRLWARARSQDVLEDFLQAEECRVEPVSAPQVYPDFAAYQQWFKTAHEAVLNGETYQIKLSLKAVSKGKLNPHRAFLSLSQRNPSPERFFYTEGDLSLIGASPETLIEVVDGQALTRPIGGTLRKHGWESGSPVPRALADVQSEFLQNAKEVAEHSMLVDLERNDLGSVCQPFSVRIESFMEVEEYSHLYHIVTGISGRLRPQVHLSEILAGMGPGGTITGCPRYRTMELIDQIEKRPRGFYSGCFGCVGPGQNMNFNLILRTLIQDGNQLSVQAGGGIVSASDADYEYAENLSKAKALLELLG